MITSLIECVAIALLDTYLCERDTREYYEISEALSLRIVRHRVSLSRLLAYEYETSIRPYCILYPLERSIYRESRSPLR